MDRIALALIVAAVVTGASSIGCGDDDGSAERIDVRGVISAVNAVSNPTGDVLGSILIVGALEDDTAHDRASVTITRHTTIRSKSGDELDFSALKQGDLAEAAFTGAVAESYPVQATARRVTILEPTDEPTVENAE